MSKLENMSIKDLRNMFIFVLIVMISVIAFGCATKPVPPVAPPIEPFSPVETKTGTFYFLAANISDPFYIPGSTGFADGGKAVGMKTVFMGPPDLNTTEQMKMFEQIVANPDTKGIFYYPMDDKLGDPNITAARAKGIPVVLGSSDSPTKNRDAFIGYNNTILGQQAGKWAAKLIDCKGTVGSIGVNMYQLKERTDAFNATIKELCPDVKVVEKVSHDGSAANAAQTIEAYLVANPDLTLFWFADGGGGQQAGLWKEKQAAGVKTMFLAMDMPPATLQAVKDGIFIGSVGQDTYTEAFFSNIILNELMEGRRVPDSFYLAALLIDKSNVDKFLK